VGQLDFVFEIECSTLGGALPLPRETLEHTFFWCESWVIFTEAPVKDSACAVLLLELFQKRFFSLRSNEK
jgi:hypothetical protein